MLCMRGMFDSVRGGKHEANPETRASWNATALHFFHHNSTARRIHGAQAHRIA